MEAKIPPAPCPGLQCIHSHREWFDLDALKGLPGFDRFLRRLFRRLGVPFNEYFVLSFVTSTDSFGAEPRSCLDS